MKLDLHAISKLNPPDILDLWGPEFVAQVLMGLVAAQVAGSLMMRKYSRALARHARELCALRTYNLNLRIRMWVLADPKRIAWVRGILGEPAIKRWQKRYESLRATGKLPVTVLSKRKDSKTKRGRYSRKPFALADISHLKEQIAPCRFITYSPPKARLDDPRFTGQDRLTDQAPRQPKHAPRPEFWPDELVEGELVEGELEVGELIVGELSMDAERWSYDLDHVLR